MSITSFRLGYTGHRRSHRNLHKLGSVLLRTNAEIQNCASACRERNIFLPNWSHCLFLKWYDIEDRVVTRIFNWCRSIYVTMHFIAISFLFLNNSKLFYLIHIFRRRNITNVPESIFTYNSSELVHKDFIYVVNKSRTRCATVSTMLAKCWIILALQLMLLLYES